MNKKIIFLLLLFTHALFAQTLVINSEKFAFDGFKISKYVDSSNKLSIDDVKDIDFKLSVPNSYSNGFVTHKSIWHKFSVKNDLSKDIEFIFYDAMYFLPAKLNIYILDNKDDLIYSRYSGTNREDGKTNDLEHSLSFVKIDLEPKQTYTFYTNSYFLDGSASLFNYKIYDSSSLIDYLMYDNIFMALLLGGMIVLILYNIFIYMYTKESLYLYYVGYQFFAFIIGFIFMSGFAYKLFDVEQNEWIHYATYATPLNIIFISLFTSRIFEMKNFYPRLNKFFNFSIYFTSAYTVLSIIFDLLAYLPLIMTFGLILGFALVFVGIYMTYTKNKFGPIYLISTVSFAVLAIVTIIYYLGLLPTNAFTYNAMMIGSLIEGIGLSLLLAFRINTLKRENSSLELLSSTDGLTNLYNRRHFNEIAPRELNRAKRDEKIYAFTLLDIDNFKKYNDTYGHQEGDNALIRVAEALTNSFKRSYDIVFRLGGEEFGVIFTAKSVEEVVELAQRARANIEALQIEHKLNEPYNVLTASFGLVITDMDNISTEIDIEKLYKDVDILLYEAKAQGRNQVKTKVF